MKKTKISVPQIDPTNAVRLQALRADMNILWRRWSPLLNAKAATFTPTEHHNTERHCEELLELTYLCGRMEELARACCGTAKHLFGNLHSQVNRHLAAVKANRTRKERKATKAAA